MTDTPDPVGELIENLKAHISFVYTHSPIAAGVMAEAADSLSALQGQVREREQANRAAVLRQAQQDVTIARQRDALESICDTTRTLTAVRALEFQEIAKAALNPPTRTALAPEPNTPEKEER
jgi:hypothetical protein